MNLNGLSRLTIWAIAANPDLIYTAGGNDETGWMGWITLDHEDHYRPLVNTSPDALYKTKQEAIDAVLTIKADAIEFCNQNHMNIGP